MYVKVSHQRKTKLYTRGGDKFSEACQHRVKTDTDFLYPVLCIILLPLLTIGLRIKKVRLP